MVGRGEVDDRDDLDFLFQLVALEIRRKMSFESDIANPD
jgi:hypothetical protein